MLILWMGVSNLALGLGSMAVFLGLLAEDMYCFCKSGGEEEEAIVLR